MRFLLVLLVLFGCAVGQVEKIIQALPSCATTCVIKAIPSSNCSLTDLPCICSAEPLWIEMELCVRASCTVREGLASQKIAADACGWPVRDKGLAIAILGPVLCAVALIFVLIRLIARRQADGHLSGWDDVVIVIAWCAGLPMAVFDVMKRNYGLGQDIWQVPFDSVTELLKYFYVGELTYLVSTVLVKISLLMFFLRIFPNRWFRRFTKVMIAVVIAFGIGFFFPLAFQCRPIQNAWLRWDGQHPGYCINIYVGGFVHAALNMVLDVIILLMPMPLLYRLQLRYSWRQRSHVFVMFSFGVIVVVVCILRLNALVTFGDSQNPTWDFMGTAVWSMVEVQVSIICACLPAAKAFFAKFMPNWLASTSNHSRPTLDPESQKEKTLSVNKDWISKPIRRASVSVKPLNRDDSGFTELEELDDKMSQPEGTKIRSHSRANSRSNSRSHIVSQYVRSSSRGEDYPPATALSGDTAYSRSNSPQLVRGEATKFTRPTNRLDQYARPLSTRVEDARELDSYAIARC